MVTVKDYDFNIATWNVMTMLQPAKMAEIADECIKYKINICALQGIRFGKQSEIRKQHYSVYYSGADRPGFKGTGFYVYKTLRNSILAFKPINERMCYLRLNRKFQNISLLSNRR